ncbi:hypothetical protein [Nocardia sp. NBC_00416]|uniref:hypothetical protein n=1 Tax=Nocardia sp. NBC_00416 TaxID=2975991 RepID=UPI002E247EDA
MTRSLLAHIGYTTPALEALVHTDLDIRVLQQHDTQASRLTPTVAGVLKVSGHDRVLVRRSALVHEELTVSVNLVVATRGRAADYGVDDQRTPIGRSLMARGARQQRRVLRADLARWPDGRMCAARAYIMTLDHRPLCYIRESFNPDIVSPDHCEPTRFRTWDDEPVPSGGPVPWS